jgi:hypothetical protein
MCNDRLPEQFKDLEAFVGAWALATQTERKRKRVSSTIEELRVFHDAILPRMDKIITHLNQFPLDNLPEDAKRLFDLALSLMEVAPAVEIFGQPDVPEAFAVDRLEIREVAIKPKRER